MKSPSRDFASFEFLGETRRTIDMTCQDRGHGSVEGIHFFHHSMIPFLFRGLSLKRRTRRLDGRCVFRSMWSGDSRGSGPGFRWEAVRILVITGIVDHLAESWTTWTDCLIRTKSG